LTRRLASFVELTTVTNINAQQGVDERLVGRPQVHVGPGLNIRIRPGLEFVLGQAPLRGEAAAPRAGSAGAVGLASRLRVFGDAARQKEYPEHDD